MRTRLGLRVLGLRLQAKTLHQRHSPKPQAPPEPEPKAPSTDAKAGTGTPPPPPAKPSADELLRRMAAR